MTERRCENCEWWEAMDGDHRYVGAQVSGIFVGVGFDGLCLRYPQPVGKRAGQWCGEFKPREQATDAEP